VRLRKGDRFERQEKGGDGRTMMTTCSRPLARASSPHFFQCVAEVDSSPGIIVEPGEKKWTSERAGWGAIIVARKSRGQMKVLRRKMG
jgi:hypothetical protein